MAKPTAKLPAPIMAAIELVLIPMDVNASISVILCTTTRKILKVNLLNVLLVWDFAKAFRNPFVTIFENNRPPDKMKIKESPPCKILGPIINELAQEFEGKALVAKINTEINPQLSQHFKIKSIPTIIFINKGQMVERFQGLIPKPNLEEILNDYINENMEE